VALSTAGLVLGRNAGRNGNEGLLWMPRTLMRLPVHRTLTGGPPLRAGDLREGSVGGLEGLLLCEICLYNKGAGFRNMGQDGLPAVVDRACLGKSRQLWKVQ
jgi:hypothetical protein